jgi:hypothetical protein
MIVIFLQPVEVDVERVESFDDAFDLVADEVVERIADVELSTSMGTRSAA